MGHDHLIFVTIKVSLSEIPLVASRFCGKSTFTLYFADSIESQVR